MSLHFDTQSLGPDFSAQNSYALVGVSYADFTRCARQSRHHRR